MKATYETLEMARNKAANLLNNSMIRLDASPSSYWVFFLAGKYFIGTIDSENNDGLKPFFKNRKVVTIEFKSGSGYTATVQRLEKSATSLI